MGPLVYYARWQGVRLRLQGREGSSVWGFFVNDDEEGSTQIFRFDNQTHELLLGEGDSQRRVFLDEMGVIIPGDTTPPSMTSSAVEP